MSWTDWLPVTRRQFRYAIKMLEETMAENADALAELDAQIDELESYVLSDDATDAAEVRTRVDRLKNLLTQAQGGLPDTPGPV